MIYLWVFSPELGRQFLKMTQYSIFISPSLCLLTFDLNFPFWAQSFSQGLIQSKVMRIGWGVSFSSRKTTNIADSVLKTSSISSFWQIITQKRETLRWHNVKNWWLVWNGKWAPWTSNRQLEIQVRHLGGMSAHTSQSWPHNETSLLWGLCCFIQDQGEVTDPNIEKKYLLKNKYLVKLKHPRVKYSNALFILAKAAAMFYR